MENETLTTLNQIMPWSVALIIGIGSALLSWRMTSIQLKESRKTIELQVNSSNISSKRQDWIHELRNCLSEIISDCMILITRLHREETNVVIGETEEYSRIVHLATKIRLLLNPDEQLSKELNTQIVELYKVGLTAGESFPEIVERVIETSQRVLKKEWERVKINE